MLNYFSIFILCLVFIKLRNFLIFFLIYVNSVSCINIYASNTVPHQLLIGFNSWHPMLFYFTLILSLLSLFKLEPSLHIKRKYVISLGVVALLLGGYWGLGNSVWGYFWVNDSIELMLLFFVCITTITIHMLYSRCNVNSLKIIILAGVFLLISMRYGLVFTRHSFFNFKNLNNVSVTLIMFLFYLKPKYIFFLCLIKKLNFGNLLLNLWLFYIINRGLYVILSIHFVFYLFHLSIFAIYLQWIKSIPQNILFFKFTTGSSIILKAIFSKGYFTPLAFFLKNKFTKAIMYNSLLFVYSIKIISKAIVVYVAYYYSIWLVFIGVIVILNCVVEFEFKLYFKKKTYF